LYIPAYEIWKAWHAARLHTGVPHEVECIRNLVETALPEVQAVWRKSLRRRGIQLRIQGVICHGRPWVRYSQDRCELGDFLMVHDHQRSSGAPVDRRAVIVQAKVFHQNGVRARNAIQLRLYQSWPPFFYENWPGGIDRLIALHRNNGLTEPRSLLLKRDLTFTGSRGSLQASSADLDEGCRFGMIDVAYSRWGDPSSGMNPWRLCSAQSKDVYTSKAGLTLAGYLLKLMTGEVGRCVPYVSWPRNLSSACHWSLTVAELLSLVPQQSNRAPRGISFLSRSPGISANGRQVVRATRDGEVEEAEGPFGIIQINTFERGPERG
jgi:hypothetical protein